MKKILTFCCALLGFGAMAMANATSLTPEENSVTFSADDLTALKSEGVTAVENDGTFTRTTKVFNLSLTAATSSTITFKGTVGSNSDLVATTEQTSFAAEEILALLVEQIPALESATGADGATYSLSDIKALTISGISTGSYEVESTEKQFTVDASDDNYEWTLESAIATTVGWQTINWDALENYDAIKVALVMEDDENYSSWGLGGIYSRESDSQDDVIKKSFSGASTGEYIEYVYTLEDLKTAVGTANTLVVNVWSPVVGFAIYGGTAVEASAEGSTNKTWRFDDQTVFASLYENLPADGKLTTDFSTEDGLTITVGDGTVKPQSEGGTLMIGSQADTGYPIVVTFENRLQMGQGSAGTKACIGVPVEGACTVYLVAASSSSTDERVIKVAVGSTETETTLPAVVSGSQATTNCLLSYAYEGTGSETIYFYSSNSSINFFYIYVSYDGTEPEFTDAVVVEPKEFELDGYLTVSVAGTITTQEVTVNVTKNEDETMTVELGDLAVSIATIADASVTFTLGTDGTTYTDGKVNGTVSILGQESSLSDVTATGSYIVDADGETTFTASFTYSYFNIEVTFTTVEPVAEPEYGWTLITDEFDEGNIYTSNNGNYITLAWADLADYTQIAIVAYTSQDYDDWGNIQVDQNWNAVGSNWTTTTGAEYQYIVYDLADLQEAVDTKATTTTEVFYITFWANTTSAAVYGYGEISEESGNQEETIEDFVLDIAGCVTDNNVNIWSEDCVPTVNTDGTSVDVAFAGTWAGFGFIQTSWASWDLTDYEAAEMTYEFETGYTPTAYTDYVTFQLQTAGDKAYVVSEPDYENTGKITLVFADHTVGTYTDWDNDGATEDATMDYSNINQIGVQASTEFNITIKEIRFIVKYTTGDIEGDEGGSTAISNVNVEVTEVARYNLMGQKISGEQKGINIIVYSDGSAKKVLVK